MPVYMIIEIDIEDEAMYSRYIDHVYHIVTHHGGRYLARSGEVMPLSGDWRPDRIVLIEFETFEQLQACFSAPEYRSLAPLRERSTRSRAIVVPHWAEERDQSSRKKRTL